MPRNNMQVVVLEIIHLLSSIIQENEYQYVG